MEFIIYILLEVSQAVKPREDNTISGIHFFQLFFISGIIEFQFMF